MAGTRYLATLRGLGLVAALLAGGSAAALAEAPVAWGETGPAPAGAGSGLARLASAPMRLGFPADRWSPEPGPRSGAQRAERCRRWRAVAESLGETFAGHTLRKTLVSRNCAMFEPDAAVSPRWDWPWSGLDRGRLVPPRQHRAFGPWTIRCGAGAARRRCALLHETDGADGEAGPVTTHFVIDRVAGREVLLWRLFLPRAAETGPAIAGLSGTGSAAPLPSRPARDMRYRLGPDEPWERFPVCVATGCLMEIGAEPAGRIATGLADGRPPALELSRGEGEAMAVRLPAQGFGPALAELIRLRRAERAR